MEDVPILDDEDDFNEFGGFEMADVPATAAEAQPLPAALQGGPVNWLLTGVPLQVPASEVSAEEALSSSTVINSKEQTAIPAVSGLQKNDAELHSCIETAEASNTDSPRSSDSTPVVQSDLPIHPMVAGNTATLHKTPSGSSPVPHQSLAAMQLELCRRQLNDQALLFSQLQEQHEKQLIELRQMNQSTVVTLTEQYQNLYSESMMRCQEDCRQQMKEFRECEQATLQEVLQAQQELMKKTLEEERLQMTVEFEKCLQEHIAAKQEEYENFQKKERERIDEEIARGLQEQADRHIKEVREALELERIKLKQAMDEEREESRRLLQEERDHSAEAIQSACELEQKQAKEAMDLLVDEQLLRLGHMIEETLASAREQIKLYVDEQRKVDHSSRQNLLSSVDILLKTACQQLQQLRTPPGD